MRAVHRTHALHCPTATVPKGIALGLHLRRIGADAGRLWVRLCWNGRSKTKQRGQTHGAPWLCYNRRRVDWMPLRWWVLYEECSNGKRLRTILCSILAHFPFVQGPVGLTNTQPMFGPPPPPPPNALSNKHCRWDWNALGPNSLGSAFGHRTACPTSAPVRAVRFEDFIVHWTRGGGGRRSGQQVHPLSSSLSERRL